jgi:hypothetical protein
MHVLLKGMGSEVSEDAEAKSFCNGFIITIHFNLREGSFMIMFCLV